MNIKKLYISLVIAILVGTLSSCTTPTTENDKGHSINDYPFVNTSSEQIATPSTQEEPPATEEALTVAPKDADASTAVPQEPETQSSWHESTKEHDITVDSILEYTDGSIFNFSSTVAVSLCADSKIVSETETESGFTISVIDNDSVAVRFFNNTDDDTVPVKLTAELATGDIEDTSGNTEYIIKGYSKGADGFGAVYMALSNGYTIKAGVLKEQNKLYAANVVSNATKAETIVNYRKALYSVFDEYNVRPDNATFTDPIYYPIVPVASGETTDTAYWLAKSDEIIDENWTDAHKVMVIYNYILDNFAYDTWVVNNGAHSRTFYYKDFKGTYFTSKTSVGVCEDFSQIIAIMCREQNIPAVVTSSGTHAWNAIYIEDYGRWISLDATSDLIWNCTSEDSTQWVPFNGTTRYKHADMVSGDKINAVNLACIGNEKDMIRHNIDIKHPD